MKKLKNLRHEKEFDTMTIITDMDCEDSIRATKETHDRKSLSDTRADFAEGQPTQVYEPRPLTPDDEIYEDIIEQFASAPTKPKYWFEEFGDYWSCSCGHINSGDYCKSCGLERELLRSLFILHKPAGAAGKLNKKLKNTKDQVDKESQQYNEKDSRRKERESSGEDLTKVVPIEDSLPIVPSRDDGITGKSKSKVKIVIAIAICIALIGIGGYAIYNYMAAPALQYEEAIQLMEDGKYEDAIEKFTELGEYNDSQDMVRQCWTLMGDDYYKSGKYDKAINAYETSLELKEDKSIYEKIRLCYIGIGDTHYKNKEYEKALGAYAVAAEMAAGEDVQQKIDDTKFAYIKEFKTDRTDQVETYLAELMESNYPGIKEIYDEYYAWHTSIVANTSESDYSSDVATVSRKDTVYFHATLSGGEPSETISLYYEVKWPDGHKEIYDLRSGWKAGDKVVARFQYSIPLFGKEGKLTFMLYDSNTKELLGSDSVTFKN